MKNHLYIKPSPSPIKVLGYKWNCTTFFLPLCHYLSLVSIIYYKGGVTDLNGLKMDKTNNAI